MVRICQWLEKQEKVHSADTPNWLQLSENKAFLSMQLQFSSVDRDVAVQSEGKGDLRRGDFSGSFLTLPCSKFFKHTDVFHTPLHKELKKKKVNVIFSLAIFFSLDIFY